MCFKSGTFAKLTKVVFTFPSSLTYGSRQKSCENVTQDQSRKACSFYTHIHDDISSTIQHSCFQYRLSGESPFSLRKQGDEESLSRKVTVSNTVPLCSVWRRQDHSMKCHSVGQQVCFSMFLSGTRCRCLMCTICKADLIMRVSAIESELRRYSFIFPSLFCLFCIHKQLHLFVPLNYALLGPHFTLGVQ